ncbi:uncharacterized protein ACWYII_007183 isoform 1-T2 [Salvelinus alpinus]
MEEPLKALFGVTEESLLISLVEGHSNPTSSSSSELSCAIVGEVVHQLNSGLSVAIQASSGSFPPMDSQDIAAGKEVIRVASVQILAELQSKTSEPEWVGFIEPLMDPVTDDVLDAIVGTMDKMAQDFNILLDLAKKMTILGSTFLTNLQCDLDVECPSGKEGTTHFLKETGSSTSVVARKLQTLSSPDFQSKALKAVSTILTRKVSSSSGMAPSSRPSSAAPSLTEAPLNTSSTALTSVTSTATVIVKAFVGGMETIASFEGTCEAVDWPVPVNDHKTGSSQKITFSPAHTLYGLIRAKLRDLLTLSAREEGVAKDASLQEYSDTLEKATVSTVEVQLPSTKLSRVPSESQPIPALCLSNLDTSTQEVLSSVFSIYKSELSKVESKSLDVVSSSDDSLEACWFVDGVLSELDDYTISQSPSPNEDLSVNEPLHRNSPVTDSSRPPSAKASFRSSTPSFTSKGTSLVPKGDGIDIEEKEVCIPSSSGHLRELLITPDISSATAFLLQYLMDSSKDDVMCLVTILVIRLLSKIRPSALDGPSQQAADMTETSQQLIRQVLSEFCAASRFSRTQAYSQKLHIHRVFRGVHKNLMEEFGSYNTLQAAISSQDPAFDRVLVKSLTQQLVQGCKEASRPASAATNPSDQAETERGAEQKARRSFLCFSMTKLRINFKRSKRGNKKDCHSVQEQTEIPSTDGHCIAPVGEVSPSISQPIKKRSLIVRVFSAMMKPFRCFTKKNL